MAHPSTQDVIDLARALIRGESGSDVPLIQDQYMVLAVAEADREALRAYRKGGGNTPSERALDTGFTLPAETALTVATTSASTTVSVGTTTGYDASGRAIVWDALMPDQFAYTALTATSFTGVTELAFNHEVGDACQALVALPTNFGRFRRSEEYGDGVQLNGAPLRFMEGPPNPGYFSLVDDGTTKYLWLYRGATGDASVLFDKDSNTIDDIGDLISLPVDWLHFYAWRTAQLSLFGRGDYDIIQIAQANADKAKLDLLKDRNVGRMVRVRRYDRFGGTDYSLALRENAL